jgi:WD40 repeat protein
MDNLKSGPHAFEDHPPLPVQVALSPDGSLAFTGGGDLIARRWNVKTEKETRPVVGHTARAVTVALSSDGAIALSGGADTLVYAWDVKTRNGRLCEDNVGEPFATLISPDAQHLFAINRAGTTHEWHAATGRTEVVIPWKVAQPPHRVTLAPDGQRILYLCSDRNTYIRDLKQSDSLQGITGPELGQSLCAAFTPDGKNFVTGGQDCFLRFWDVSGRELASFPGHRRPVRAVVCLPDGHNALSVSDDRDKRLLQWDFKAPDTFKRAVTLEWSFAQASAPVFSPDAKLLAMAGPDGRVLLWETATGKQLKEWTLPGAVHGLAFSGDSKRLATANGNGTVYVYQLNLPVEGASSSQR